VITGALGLIWLTVFRIVYRRPEEHPRLSSDERAYILSGRDDPASESGEPLGYGTLLRLPQTWGYVLSKTFTDPVWFFITDWFAVYLVAKGFKLEESLAGFLIPFFAADLGNVFGGGLSSVLIARGWKVGAARKLIAVIGGLGMMMLVPTVWATSFVVIVLCFAIATFAYAAFSTIILNLPADVFPSRSVASVSGLGGTGAGLGTIAAIYLTGWVADHYSFEPILLGASLLPLVAMAAVLLLVRNNRATEAGIVKAI
jgi:ACS family hexuronate transporter-like MFS transporter